MQKPELIIALEKELDTTFTKVPIEEINCWNLTESANYTTNNASEIIGLRIQKLHLTQLPSSIKAFQNVKILDLSFNGLTNISVLSHLKQLTTLRLGNNQLTDISALKHLKKLKQLDLEYNKFTDISTLRHLTKLIHLNLGRNKLTDISVLSHLKQLEFINLGNTSFEPSNLIRFEQSMGEILTSKNHNRISNISALSSLTKLTALFLKENELTDISALQDLKQLKQLDLQQNPIQELPEWICDFPNMNIQWENTLVGDKGYITLYDNPLQEPPIEIVKLRQRGYSQLF